MITTRTATPADATAISALLTELDYLDTAHFIDQRLAELLVHPDERVLVAEEDGALLGVLSLHFIPQLALKGDFCRISYFCVSSNARSKGIGRLLESEGEALARARGCDRIEVHCHSRRSNAHRFYYRQGYTESPKYLCKSLAAAGREGGEQ
ncbi:N-acetyltransferase [Cronobacter sakazakii]|nr:MULTISPECIES: GNAT family N-acetyltransferase [Cronobacter]AXX02039.1 N-acetyltransferase [Cronobacter sakazakii]EGT4320529.1 GNAT family N-acetyltransferase [Cronobacter sakazakii]EGT4949991.1 GNAT family N-acetyltransferase [Cronobacter sakazakii]EGT5666704.1 GNAT family N-acetyltransferase [Cronobacter sakazakii]EGZ6857269.1 GNAT family N-acetyltransferase [Cronobacter sakazakii]